MLDVEFLEGLPPLGFNADFERLLSAGKLGVVGQHLRDACVRAVDSKVLEETMYAGS